MRGEQGAAAELPEASHRDLVGHSKGLRLYQKINVETLRAREECDVIYALET